MVVDEQGNEYEATYPKRAKGLVKNGRARFVSENKICLACPPNIDLEELDMVENIYNIDYVLSQIAKMQEQTEYLNNALEKLSVMGDGDSGDCGAPGNIQGQAKANAIADIVKYRETTNQHLLSLYEKMYDDLKAMGCKKTAKFTIFVETIKGKTHDIPSGYIR